MTVQSLSEKCGFKAVVLSKPNREIVGAYSGDLLSWVMGRASEDNAWITIMSNVNVIAVATLVDVSCIIIAENVIPDENLLSIAREKSVNVLLSPLNAYDTAIKISGFINE